MWTWEEALPSGLSDLALPFLRVTNPGLLKEVKDSEPSFTAAADGAVWVVGGSKDCIFYHRAVKLPPCNTLPVQGKRMAFFKLCGRKLLKYKVFNSPISP